MSLPSNPKDIKWWGGGGGGGGERKYNSTLRKLWGGGGGRGGDKEEHFQFSGGFEGLLEPD